MSTMVIAPNSNWANRMEIDMTLKDTDLEPNQITCFVRGDEMLRIGPDGFWVRGVKIPQDGQEAEAVYKAMKEFLSWSTLQRA